MTYYIYFFDYAAPTSSTTSAEVWIGIGVAIPMILMLISAIVIGILLRRCLHRDRPRNPLDHTTSTHNTAYSMNQRSPNSNQAPPQNVNGAQPTGQYASSSPYRTSYPQQPPSAPYSTEEPPSAPHSTEEPPSAPYSTAKPPPVLYFSGGEAPPPYPG